MGETFASTRQTKTNANILGFGCDGVRSFPQDVLLEGLLEGQRKMALLVLAENMTNTTSRWYYLYIYK